MSSQFQLDEWRVGGSGHWFIGVAGEAISARDAVRFGTNGRIYRTDADAVAYMPCMGIALDAASAAGINVAVLIQGFVELPGNVWTAGAKLYVTTAPGALSHTAPTGVDDIVQEVGFAVNTTQIYFNPQLGAESVTLLIDYEVQTGIIAEPTTTAKGDGHLVEVLYTMYDPDRVVLWKYANGGWYGTEAL